MSTPPDQHLEDDTTDVSRLFAIEDPSGLMPQYPNADGGPTLVVGPSFAAEDCMPTPPPVASRAATVSLRPPPRITAPSVRPGLRPPEQLDLGGPTGLEAPPPLPLRPPRAKRQVPWGVVAALTFCFSAGGIAVDYIQFGKVVAERNTLRDKLAKADSELAAAKSQVSDLLAAKRTAPQTEPSTETVVDEVSQAIAAAYAPATSKTAPKPKAKATKPAGTKVVTVASVPPERTEKLKGELATVLERCEAAFGHKLCVKESASGQNVAVVVSPDGEGMSESEARNVLSCFKGRPDQPFVGDLNRYQEGCR